MNITKVISLVLAGIIGSMSVISGASVLLGLHEVGYTVLKGLVVYNVAVGVLSIITAFLIWKNFTLSKKLTSLILIFHVSVLAYLYFFSETVAMESIKAMTFRVVVWVLIFILIRLKTAPINTSS
ncbi:MAG: hypothetical protein WBM98_13050 [Maribacter sp.]|uniref:hypothetical protein n=1 Tax=Maribacter sp. TaxID=1897614 RepID=UPI003C78764B